MCLVLLAACDASTAETPVELPATAVACGDGNGGEILGTVQTLDGSVLALPAPAPVWVKYIGPGGSDAAPGLVLVAEPRLAFFNVGSVNRMLPVVGEYDVSANAGSVNGGAHVIVDASDEATACLAGRFDAHFNGGGSGHLAGWFRTR
jgi:hypothetical protein